MKQKFATNLLLLILVNLLVKPFWIFGIDRNVQNIVGSGEYGLFFSLFNFSLLLNIVLDFGLTNFNNREISRYSQLVSKYMSNIVGVKLLLALFYFVFSIGLAIIMGYNGRQMYLLSFLVVNQFLSSLILYFRSNLSGLHLFKTDSLLSVLDKTLMIAICSIMIWGRIDGFVFTIEWFVYSQTFSYFITAIIAFLLVYKNISYFKLTFDRLFLISIIKQSSPYAILVLLMTIYSRIDSVLIERLLPGGNVEAGIYAQAFRLLDAASMVPFLFAGLLLPMFSKMIKNNESIQPLTAFAFSLLIIPGIALSFSCIVYRSELINLFYHSHISESSVILGLLMLSFIFISINYIFGTLLTANGNLKVLNIISGIGVVLNLVVNIILIPRFQATGAAYTNLTVQLIITLLQVYASWKIFRFRVSSNGLIKFILFLMMSLTFTYLSRIIFDTRWEIGFIVSVIVIGLSSLLLKLIDLKELASLLFEDKR